MTCSLFKPNDKGGQKDSAALAGSLVSSLHRLKDVDNKDGGFFVFGDISVKVAGQHRLQFSLYELRKDTVEVACLGSIVSDSFNVVHQKDFKGLDESTYLSRAFSDQGVRLRLRKEPRTMLGAGTKRPYSYTSPQDQSVPNTPMTSNAQPSQPVMYGADDMDQHSAKRPRYSDSTTSSASADDQTRAWSNYQARTTLPGSYGTGAMSGYSTPGMAYRSSSYSTYPSPLNSTAYTGLPRSDFTFRTAPQASTYEGQQNLQSGTGNQPYSAQRFPLQTFDTFPQVTTPTSDSGDGTQQAANTLSALHASQHMHDQVASQLSPPQERFLSQ